MKGMKHVVRFTYKPLVRLFRNKNVVLKECFMANLVKCKTECDLLRFRKHRREMEEVPVILETFLTPETYL
jgi:hypothetical protein